ncbi:hypothetical protein [Caballeronia cordobensis]|uniref:hypothetical protein n=1 Tax=Caballeronia cordobensis TaxID=1353886 RepID=UPI00045F0025|nr:hypothetical protein BRPE67_ACDS09550 [Burkholderia sp. RPE67]
MGLFKPRAPKAPPEGARIQFHFASDRQVSAAAASPVQLDEAIKRVQAELASLRATVAAASARSAKSIEADIERRKPESAALSAALDKKRAQCMAGLIEISEVEQLAREREAKAVVWRAQQAELQRRNAADAAQAEIDRILQEIA